MKSLFQGTFSPDFLFNYLSSLSRPRPRQRQLPQLRRSCGSSCKNILKCKKISQYKQGWIWKTPQKSRSKNKNDSMIFFFNQPNFLRNSRALTFQVKTVTIMSIPGSPGMVFCEKCTQILGRKNVKFGMKKMSKYLTIQAGSNLENPSKVKVQKRKMAQWFFFQSTQFFVEF